MESGEGARAKTGNLSAGRQFLPHGPESTLAPHSRQSLPHGSESTAVHRRGSAAARSGTALMDTRTAGEMKIIIFPVNIDKFTGFFDKFPETNERCTREEIDMITDGYGDIIKNIMNIYRD
ncbi:MAG: hypothetical protein OXE44_01585 [Nitrospinae bacterium]|nr:hypothetical protein [Nitrospinota bacterium]